MTRTSAVRIPSYRLHRATGNAVVTLRGKDHYLGPHGTSASRRSYEKLIAEYLSSGFTPANSNEDLTVDEVLAAFWKHVKAYYIGPDGKPAQEQINIRYALRPLRKLYGNTLAADFGPLSLKAVRQAMIEKGWARTHINHQINRLRHVFKWATENELVPAGVYQRLQTISGLRFGKSEAKETEPVKPVPDEHVDARKGLVSRQVWGMIELQRLTGMRSGEVVLMRGRDLDMTGEVWTYTPARHKTQYRGHQRIVHLGPKAQAIVTGFLKPELDVYLFSPADAEAERRAQKSAMRRTPLSCGNRPGTNKKRKPRKAAGERYTTDSYRRAIEYGIKKAKVPHWHPHQLRHSAATKLRNQFGLDAARIILGHKTAAVTEVYAAVDFSRAAEVVAKVG